MAHAACVWTTIPVAQGPRAVWLDRLVSVVVAAAAVVCTGLLWSVAPDERGYDTHVQLGMTACGWPESMGLPCPTCGATTAACHLVHGNLLAAFATQPFGAAVAAAGLVAGVVALWCLALRRSLLDIYAQLPVARILVGGTLLFVLSWGYKCLVFEAP